MLALTKGEKFVPKPPPLSDEQLIDSIKDYIRRLKIKYYFTFISKSDNPNYIRSLYVPNPLFEAPKDSSGILEDYFTNVMNKTHALLLSTPRSVGFRSTNSEANVRNKKHA
jgi:hypothetical protein